MDGVAILFIIIALIIIFWLILRTRSAKPKASMTRTIGTPPKNISPEMMGARYCAVCGTGWKSTYGMLKDSGMLDTFASFAGSYSPENLAGLTCTRCGKSFCKQHLNQVIPQSLPGGHCPSCSGPMFVA